MKYESAKTSKGNVGVSYENQEAADAQAKAMDDGGNVNCYNCSNCFGCSNCSDCFGCSNCSDCSGCSSCSRCSYCSGCFGCSRCSYCSGCSGCSYCSGVLIWKGKPARNLLALNGLKWPVSISSDEMQIGCQIYPIAKWAKFKDETIAKMDGNALEFWRQYKPMIMALCDSKKG